MVLKGNNALSSFHIFSEKYPSILVCYLIMILCITGSSCSSKKSQVEERNIDVDSDIYIVPVGDVDEKYLPLLVPKLERRFTTNVYLALDKKVEIPDYSYNPERQQYIAMYILTEMVRSLKFEGDYKILGVCNVDLYVPESDLAFVFGQAIRNGKAALISMLRMDPRSYVGGKPNDELLVQRMIKEAIHELGHCFGLDNVYEPECVMYLPRDLKELDRKTDNFCLISQQEFIDIMKKKKGKK